MAEIYIRDDDAPNGKSIVGTDNPLPVREVAASIPRYMTVKQMLERGADITGLFTGEGRVFYATDADANDRVTGQTSFADTTPTFTLRVPAGTVAVPILVALCQTGSVAGGDVDVIMEFAPTDRYSSSGTSEAIKNARMGGTGLPNPTCSLYTGATISAVSVTHPFGQTPWRVTVGPDVSPAEGISNELIWTPTGPDFIEGPASINVYTYAASTAPTWYWTFKWIEIPLDRMGF